MSKPKIFIGSSHDNISISNAVKAGLDDIADITIWNQNFFKNNKSFLQSLLESLDDFDYAIFIYAADDKTANIDDPGYIPRDNVVFESGLFMGSLGSPKVFIIYDRTKELKIPTDFSGIFLYSFNGCDETKSQNADVSNACARIKDEIKSQSTNFSYLQGRWKSDYNMEFKEGTPLVSEEVIISAYRQGIKFKSQFNPQGDYYTAFGEVNEGNSTICGKWISRKNESETDGFFMLFISPDRDSMYGYFTSTDQRNGVLFASWVLTKIQKDDEITVANRLKRLQQMLTLSTRCIVFPKTNNSTSIT